MKLLEAWFENAVSVTVAGTVAIFLGTELDFLVEAQNSEKCLQNFQKQSPHIAESIYVPMVYWNLSTSKLLTMEYMDGVQVNDVKGIQKMGILPYGVSRLLSETFAEMIYKHGFVHCDPHAANLLVRPLPSGKRNFLGKLLILFN
ncbi:hypothetical protein RDABS01_022727 [Bienertia sinuspersici]